MSRSAVNQVGVATEELFFSSSEYSKISETAEFEFHRYTVCSKRAM